MSKKGLPFDVKMRHDSHYVDELARSIRTVGRKIQTDLLEPNPNQPRTEIGDLSDLAGSIGLKGVLEPILVKPNPQNGTWMIIAGERRWRAATIAGLTEVPCIELDIDENDIAEIALIENLQRKDLTIWEEADGYAYLIKKFSYTHDEVAKKIGKSRSTVTECLSIAGLPAEIRAKCTAADINTKSSLLEVARQFDEKAMHSFLDDFSRSKKANKQTIKSSKTIKEHSASKSDTAKIDNFAAEFNEPTEATNVYSFVSRNKDYQLHLTFNKQKEFHRTTILNALKEIFNEIKNNN